MEEDWRMLCTTLHESIGEEEEWTGMNKGGQHVAGLGRVLRKTLKEGFFSAKEEQVQATGDLR